MTKVIIPGNPKETYSIRV